MDEKQMLAWCKEHEAAVYFSKHGGVEMRVKNVRKIHAYKLEEAIEAVEKILARPTHWVKCESCGKRRVCRQRSSGVGMFMCCRECWERISESNQSAAK